MTRYLKLRSWLQRNRRWAFALSALFLMFEASRALSIGQYLLPELNARTAEPIAIIMSLPPWAAVFSTALAIVFFAVPMAAVIYAGIRIRRALSHYYTSVNEAR